LYTGAVPPGSIQHIAGFLFVPRIMLAATVTFTYWTTDPFIVAMLWTLGVLVDIVGNIVKLAAYRRSMVAWKENIMRGPAAMRSWY